jgi:uncharacterized membrane protein
MQAFRRFWADLRSSLWFVPSFMVIGAIGLAILLIELSDLVGTESLQDGWPRLFGAGEDGSRELLGAVAMSMITVTGVVFSVTVLTLAQASSQYSPRLLRNFMGRWQVRVVLGVFAGIFTYSIIVLRTIRGGDDPVVHPLAVFGGMVLAVVGIGFLIFFIHHIASSLQASVIIDAVTRETRAAIERLFPDDVGEAVDDVEPEAHEATRWAVVPASESGYLQKVESQRLIQFAREREIVVRMERRIGEFVVEGAPLVSVADVDTIDRETAGHLNALFLLNAYRTVEQDAAFGIREIVDIALKGLSPSINDETTTITCIDHLAVLLSVLADRRLAPRARGEHGEVVRVIARGPTFDDLVSESFDQIRIEARGKPAILRRLCWCIETVALRARGERRRPLLEQLRLLLEDIVRIEPRRDRDLLLDQAERTARALGTSLDGVMATVSSRRSA